MINTIIFQAWQTFQEFNQTDVAGLFTYPAHVWAGFIPLVLFALFCIVLMSTFFSQKRLRGKGDFRSSFAVAGFFIAITASVMMLVTDLINVSTVVICIVISIIGAIILLTSD